MVPAAVFALADALVVVLAELERADVVVFVAVSLVVRGLCVVEGPGQVVGLSHLWADEALGEGGGLGVASLGVRDRLGLAPACLKDCHY